MQRHNEPLLNFVGDGVVFRRWPSCKLRWVIASVILITIALIYMSKVYYSDTFDHDQYLEDLLQFKSLQGNEKVQRFVELHESYMNQGNVKRAAHLLTKDRYLSTFSSIHLINGTDYVKTTNLSVVYHKHQDYRSAVWLLDSECMSVSLENYKTCSVLAGFYKNLGSSDAKKLGQVLNHMLRHFKKRCHFSMKIWWRKYSIYYDKSSPQCFIFWLGFVCTFKVSPQVVLFVHVGVMCIVICIMVHCRTRIVWH